MEPENLGPKALAVWKSTTSTYQLRSDELRVLEDACREIDLVEEMQRALADGELLVQGSQGQPVANPLVQELRQHRGLIRTLLGSLNLPDEDSRAAGARSAHARTAAQARWSA